MSALLLATIARKLHGVVLPAWNPSDKGADILLSRPNNVLATGTVGSWESVRSVTSHNAGKWYYEIENTVGGGGITVAGITTSGASLTNYLSASGGECCAFTMSVGTRLKNGTFTGTTASTGLTNGNSMLIAVDIPNKKLWIYCAGDAGWIGGGDPAAGTTPTSTWTTGSLTLFAGGSVNNTGKITLNTGQTAFQNAAKVPSGFTVWG